MSTEALLLDTSVFVAAETGRPLRPLPEGDARISVVTLTELGLGVHRAADPDVRVVREATLQRARRFLALGIDEAIADRLAELLAHLRAAERRTKAFDAFIAATALVYDLTVVTQDSDYLTLRAVAPELRVVTA